MMRNRRLTGPAEPPDSAFDMALSPDVVPAALATLAHSRAFRPDTLGAAYDEMFDAQGAARAHYAALFERLLALDPQEMRQRQSAADLAFLHQGITFTVYGAERRHRAHLSLRPDPAHHHRRRVGRARARPDAADHRAQPVPEGHLQRRRASWPTASCRASWSTAASTSAARCRACRCAHDIYVSVAGTDLVRLPDGQFAVLEDNLRVPSGVCYMLTNRQVIKRVFPLLFSSYDVRPVDHYGQALLATLRRWRRRTGPIRRSCCSRRASSTRPTSSTRSSPGRWASSSSRAATCSSTTTSSTCGRPPGRERVDVIYRRVDDDFLDPLAFRPDSHARRARAVQRLSRRQRRADQRHRHRRGRRQGALRVRAGASSGTTWARSRSCRTSRPSMLSNPTRSRSTCSSTSTSWWSRRSANRAATAC